MDAVKLYEFHHDKMEKVNNPLPKGLKPGFYQVTNPSFKKEMIKVHEDGFVTSCYLNEKGKVLLYSPDHWATNFGNINFYNAGARGIELFMEKVFLTHM